jgi:hypothetical protein
VGERSRAGESCSIDLVDGPPVSPHAECEISKNIDHVDGAKVGGLKSER